MPSFKSDSSFFHKIAMGAIGSRAVKDNLTAYGHAVVELERGSLEAKIWKDVKRKRVRIPDLVCTRCGQRIEVRTKGDTKLSMSHSPTIPERRWDYGMVGDDLISTPICAESNTDDLHTVTHWTRGVLAGETSYWNEKEWVKWHLDGAVNYFTVKAFRDVPPDQTVTKGAEEGAETTLIWRSCFAPCDGTVVTISEANITVQDAAGERMRRGRRNMRPLVAVGEVVRRNQVLACNVLPQTIRQLQCRNNLTREAIARMLTSQHLPVRFAGAKLARVRREDSLRKMIETMAADADEDIYVRLEAKAYMVVVHNHPLDTLFEADLSALDKADQLEAVIAIGEVGTEHAATILAAILNNQSQSYFLRSAAAYGLGRIDSRVSRNALVQAFTAQTYRVREDALAALAEVGFGAMAELLAGVNHTDEQIQAGCAEVLRWMAIRSDATDVQRIVSPIADILASEDRSLIAVWLGGQLPEPLMTAALTKVLGRDARLAYSLAVSWAFGRSWIRPLQDEFQPPKK